MRQSIELVALLACTVLVAAATRVSADDAKKDASLSGSWEKKSGQVKFAFGDKDVLKIYPHGEQFGFAIVCKYSVEKDGRLKLKVTEIDANDDVKQKVKDIAPVGLEFSFKYEIKNDAVTVDDLKGENVDAFKSHLEGEYEAKK
jgi:hypothetical protein